MNENISPLIAILCGNNVNAENCHLCKGRLSNKCRHDRYCDLCHLTDDQLAYVFSDLNSNIYLNACPGSGKTEVIGIKCAYEMFRWESKASGIAILTFTNSAEDEIRERLTIYFNQQIHYPHFLGTFTSWIHGYITNPFLSHRIKTLAKFSDAKIKIVDSSCESSFLDVFKTKYSYGKLGHLASNTFFYDVKSKKFCYCDGDDKKKSREFTKQYEVHADYIEKDLKATKWKFWNNGFFTYEDIEYLTYILLRDHSQIAELIARRFSTIIVDECQDLSYVQLLILNELHNHGSKIHLIGDLDQAIYGFRKIEPDDTRNFISRKQFQTMTLTENFRSNQSIVNISGQIVNRTTPIVGKVRQTVSSPLVVLLYKTEDSLLQEYYNLLTQEGINAQNCCAIVRNTALKSKLLGIKATDSMTSPNIIEDFAHFVYLQKSDDVSSFQESLIYLSRAIQHSYFSNEEHANSLELYKPICFDSSTWRHILLSIRKVLIGNSMLLDLNQTWRTWKNVLIGTLSTIDSGIVDGHTPNLRRLRNNVTEQKVVTTFCAENKVNQPCELKIETIHGCKGRGFDSVLFVSSSRQSGESASYWRNWFPQQKSGTTEATRLSYVAFSRAKQLLALGIPIQSVSRLDDNDLKLFEHYGFKIYNCSTQMWLT